MNSSEMTDFVEALCANGTNRQNVANKNILDGSAVTFDVLLPMIENSHRNVNASFTGSLLEAQKMIYYLFE
jgi:hypothetical protein